MDQPRWLNEAEDMAWRGVRRLDVSVLAAIRSDLQAESGLSDADYEILTALSEWDDEAIRTGELSRLVGWSTSRLSHHLARMEQRRLILRTDRTDDGRGSDVSLTPQGWKAIESAAPGHVESVRRHLFDRLTPAQVKQLAQITTALLAED